MNIKTLVDLPPELLDRILSLITTARALVRLGETCHHLHDYVESHGWEIFLRYRFPSIPVSSFLRARHPKAANFDKDAVKMLTAQSRSWDRRAFLTRGVEAPKAMMLDVRRPRHLGRRTMGYRPCIDSYTTIADATLASQREVLAYSTGPQWLVRIKSTGLRTRKTLPASHSKYCVEKDQHGHQSIWFVSGDLHASSSEDVVSVNLVRPDQLNSSGRDTEQVIVASMSGKLAQYQLELSDENISKGFSRNATYKTGLDGKATKNVYSTSLSKDFIPLLAAVVGREYLSFYKVVGPQQLTRDSPSLVEPFLTFNAVHESRVGPKQEQVWTTSWLSSTTLIAGIGLSAEPLRVFDLASNRPERPVRKFPANDGELRSGINAGQKSSVYAIQPLLSEFARAGPPGQVFLAGWYDGVARTHDLRDPRSTVQEYYDIVDTQSAIYSLAVYGRQRFVVGGARHSLIKIFDFRMPGGRAYDYRDESPCTCSSGQYNSIQQALEKGGKSCTHFQPKKKSTTDYSIFCIGAPRSRRYPEDLCESPVYALSSPSPMSSSLFIGLEEEICEHNAISIVQETLHPSPIYSTSPVVRQSRDRTMFSQGTERQAPRNLEDPLTSAWNPDTRLKKLTSYSQVEMGELKLMKQVSPAFTFSAEPTCLYDERIHPTHGLDAEHRRVFN